MSEQIVSTGNERDAIRVTVDRDLPDLWVPQPIDPETGEAAPDHYVDMSDAFKLVAETWHEACGRVHGYTVIGIKSLVYGWPEMMDKYLEEIRKSVLRAVEECPHTIHDDGPLNGPIDPDDESDVPEHDGEALMTYPEKYAPPGALVYTLEREISAYEGHELIAVFNSRTAVTRAVLDYWAEPGYGDHRLIVQAWRIGSTMSRGVFRGDRDDWMHPEEGDGPRWREMDRP